MRYYYRLLKIKLKYNCKCALIDDAALLYKIAGRLSPEFVRHYNEQVIRSYELSRKRVFNGF